jgi:hypothetical protein
MLRGGTVILRLDIDGWKEHMLCFKGWGMLWAPFPYIDENDQLWLFCCDTAGGDISHWWDFMRLYRHSVDLSNKTCGTLARVETPTGTRGLIDPSLMRIGRWYYLFYTDLWNNQNNEWWDPVYSVSLSPFGPYREYINLQVPEKGIDEAFKPYICNNGGLWCTWSSGDSGIDGSAYLGRLDVTGQHKDGWLIFRAGVESHMKAVGSTLCTAVDPGTWPLRATLRRPGYVGMRDNFFIGEML